MIFKECAFGKEIDEMHSSAYHLLSLDWRKGKILLLLREPGAATVCFFAVDSSIIEPSIALGLLLLARSFLVTVSVPSAD